MMRKLFFTLFCEVLIFTCFLSIANAQVAAKIELSPENPQPNSTVKLTLRNYSFDLGTSMMTWKVNGLVVLSGEGEDSITLKTGNVGEASLVEVLAENEQGFSVQQSLTVTPSSVTLLYEAPRSYVPNFYEGRSLASTGGLVRVSAIPFISDTGRMVSPSSLSYTWYVDNNIQKNLSGRGKQSLDARLDFLKEKTDIKVIVRTPGGNSTSKTISIYPEEILPTLYPYDDVLGSRLSYAIKGRLEETKDFAVKLEPFYVSDKESKPATFKWLLDGFDITPLGGEKMTFTPEKNSYGSKTLFISVTGHDKRLQKAETKTEFIFDTRK